MRTKSLLAGLLTTLLTVAPLGRVSRALAQSAPPSDEPPPNYTPPPPPAGYGSAPGYGAPPGAPPPPPMGGRGRAAGGGAEVRFEPDEPDLQLYNMSGGVPVERMRWHRGWWGGGYSVGYGWAPNYEPLCDQACATRLPVGPHHLALSKNGGRLVPAYGPAFIQGPSLLRASYSDHSAERAAGWVIGIGGLVGGIVMIAVSASDDTRCDADGFCSRHETVDGPLLVGGIGVLLASGIVGGILAAQRDEAHISVEPLRLSSDGGLRESLAAMGAETHPQGAALALHF